MEYSPFAIAPVASDPDLDLGELVQQAVGEEGRAMEPDPSVEAEEGPPAGADAAGDGRGASAPHPVRHSSPEPALPSPAMPNSTRPAPPPSPHTPSAGGADAGCSSPAPAPDPGRPSNPPEGRHPAAEAPPVQQRANRQRKRKREAAICSQGYQASPYSLKRHVQPAAPIGADLDYGSLPSTLCGYAARNRLGAKDKLPAEVRALIKGGYEYIPNDGMCALRLRRASHPDENPPQHLPPACRPGRQGVCRRSRQPMRCVLPCGPR